MTRFILLSLLLLLSACSSVPVAIKKAPEPDLQLMQVSNKTAQHKMNRVRWGGQLINVENDELGATLQLAEFPLNSYGRPITTKKSQGRFLVHSKEFVDPYIYKPGTLITVAGIIASEEKVQVDKKQLRLPVIEATQLYRWTESAYQRSAEYERWPYHYDHFGYGLYYPGWRSSFRYHRGFYW